MNVPTLILLVLVVVALAAALGVMVRNRKKGIRSCGCCTGDCARCANAKHE